MEETLKTEVKFFVTILSFFWLIPVVGLAQEFPDTAKVVFRTGSTVFVSGTAQNPEGFDVKLLERFLSWNKNRTGQPSTFNTTFVETMAGRLVAVEIGECDLALGSVTATLERKTRDILSVPYLPVRKVLFLPIGQLLARPYQESLSR